MSNRSFYTRSVLAFWKWATRKVLKAGYGRGYLQQFISDAPRGLPAQELRDMLKIDDTE